MRGVLAASVATVVLGGAPAPDDPGADSKQPVPTTTASAPAPASAAPTITPKAFDADRAMATVRLIAQGPRLATDPEYAEAADLLEPRLENAGYDVHRQRFPVPAGDSWGVP